ncbi:MAG: alkaline phosphatase family protein [Schleiferiaceae bacterium]|nr:alkaline phosphatase family protein [Schleiferiaceae bacterium]
MAQKDIYTLGFLAGGYRAVAQFKGIDSTQFPTLPENSASLRSLLVGWDAADWQMMTPLLTSGKMPNLTELMDGGVQAQLATLDPPISPMLWSSIATSQWPSSHGIHGFTEVNKGTVRAVRGSSLQVPAYWDVLEENGLSCTTVGWWPSHPATESKGGGIRISNLAPAEDGNWLSAGIQPSHLEPFAKALLLKPEEIPVQAIALFFPGLEVSSEDAIVRSVLKITTHALNLHTLATLALAYGTQDHASIYYDALDHYKHLGMKYHPPQLDGVSDTEFYNYQHIVTGAYRLHDLFLDALLRFTNPATNTFLISDHGFKSGDERWSQLPNHAGAPALEHRHFGIFLAKGPAIKADALTSGLTLLDMAPTLLAVHDFKATPAMNGRVAPCIAPGQRESRIPLDTQVETQHRESVTLESSMLADLIALGYLDANATKVTDQRLLENCYYLARSLRAEGRPEDAWRELTALGLNENSPLRYLQLGAALLSESGQFQALEELLTWVEKGKSQPEIWSYYRALVALSRNEEWTLPDFTAHALDASTAILWGRFLVKANQYDSLYELLSPIAKDRPDVLNLWLRYYLHRENWDAAINVALDSTELVFHQPWVHGALAWLFKKTDDLQAARTAKAVQLALLPNEGKAPLYIVTGPPRSGTSLAMQLLQSLGVEPETDEVREADQYNAAGYYEHEKIKNWTFDAQWLEEKRGRSIKIIAPLLVKAPLPEGPKVIIAMRREGHSLLQSQRHMMSNESAPMQWEEMDRWEKAHDEMALLFAMDAHATVVDLWFEDLLKAEELDEVTPRLAVAFAVLTKVLSKTVDISSLKGIVKTQLRRF